jgi:drug/metabolite transporter (DMT)-like permease
MIGKGEAFAILSALAWAFGVILYKRLGERLPPLALNLRKNSLVLLALVPLLLAFHGLELPALTPAEVAICLVSGLLGIGIADTLYFRALNQVGAARMGIVGNFYSPFVIVLAFAFLGERLTGMQLLGFVLVSAGVLVIGAARGPAVDRAALRRGLAIGVLAVLLMAVAIVMVKRVLEHADLLWVSTIRMLGGVAGMLVIAAFLGGARAPVALDRRGWVMLVVAALVGQLLSMLLWLAGYKYTSASVAAILNETASVFIVLLAWVFLGERLTRRKMIGIGCTLGGVALMLVPGGH